ncbi:dnaJ homolog subfamily B member 9-like [Xiphophorus hellerii]|uniref:dnaJ homolog subfamily B member 9-like n=1 Tax=Xiphophorus hellerii TaxID=8084 RepID=UPI0013B46698|nr:dnaJ homolog subfamily B member 9-like [Xiphophorus hellerii]XP_032405915.1 dnaJ homolog subfamily B member 9-like [Xiphophorus hellerii]
MAGQVVILRMRACLVLLLLCLSEDQQASASETVRSFYDTLNVERTASDTQIKKSFRSLAVRYHPDKNKSAQAETTFREIAEAYAVLSDKKKRRLYDSVGHEAFLENQASFEDEDEDEDEDETSFHFSFSDLFQDFHESAFMDEPHVQWSFFQEEEEEEEYIHDRHYSSEETAFSFYFDDGNEEEHYY